MKQTKEEKDIIHEIQMETAGHIIKEIIEPLLLQLEREDRDAEDGLKGELYYTIENRIIALIDKYNKLIIDEECPMKDEDGNELESIGLGIYQVKQ